MFESDHQCSVAVGQLWVELLRFYALEFNLAELVISIRLKEKVSRESKDWPKKRIAVEGIWNVLTRTSITVHFFLTLTPPRFQLRDREQMLG